MKCQLVIFFFLIAFSGSSQTGKLSISITNHSFDESFEDSTYLKATIVSRSQSTFSRIIALDWEEGKLVIDSLKSDDYRLQLNNIGSDSLIIYQCYFRIKDKKETTLDIYLSASKDYLDIIDESDFGRSKTEGEYFLGFMNNRWLEKQSSITSSITLGASISYWSCFSKHLGWLAGMGFGINHTSFAKSSTAFNLPELTKRYEYYNYAYLRPQIGIRFSWNNQQVEPEVFQKGIILDIGARYNFPLVFKHVGRFDGNYKVVESGLHQFTDFRAFASIGIAPILVFAEYRLSDFLLGSYPEMPQFTFGIKVAVHTTN